MNTQQPSTLSEQLKISLYQTAVSLASNAFILETGYEKKNYLKAKTPENIKKVYDRLVELFSEEVKPS